MVLDVPENILTYFISDRTGQRNQHGLGKRTCHKARHSLVIFSDKRHQVRTFRTETQYDGEFQKKADMKIAEIRLHCGKQQNLISTPFEQPILRSAFPDYTIDDLTEEHRHGVLVDIVPDAQKRVTRSQVPDGKQCRFG